MTQSLYVHADGLNVRNQPNGKIVGSVVHGAKVEVDSDIRQQIDGIVWRRVIASTEQWIAEVNLHTNQRFLASTPPGQSEPTPSLITNLRVTSPSTQTFLVLGSLVNVRQQPSSAGSVVRQVRGGERVEILVGRHITTSDGWVWQQLTDQNWVAEWNPNTGQRLLQLFDSSRRAIGRVQVDGTRFRLDGQPFRFIGCNLREFVFYTQNAILPHARAAHQDAQLQAIQQIGMRVIRMHVCHRQVSVGETVPLLRTVLNKIHEKKLLAIVVLNDSLGLSSYYVPGDDAYHQGQPLGHLNKQAYFIQGGYRQNYLPFVQRIVDEFRDHPAIFAWELGNEYAIHPQPALPNDGEAFLDFAHSVAAMIRDRDPNHLITTGLLNTNQITPVGQSQQDFARRLYDTPDLDFGTVHFYQDQNNPNLATEEERSAIDLQILTSLGKPTIVEEFGSTVGTPNRLEFTRSRLERWVGMGTAGFMQWGLSATGSDINVGDNLHGMDNYSVQNAPLFQALVNLYREWVQRIQN